MHYNRLYVGATQLIPKNHCDDGNYNALVIFAAAERLVLMFIYWHYYMINRNLCILYKYSTTSRIHQNNNKNINQI